MLFTLGIVDWLIVEAIQCITQRTLQQQERRDGFAALAGSNVQCRSAIVIRLVDVASTCNTPANSTQIALEARKPQQCHLLHLGLGRARFDNHLLMVRIA
jgi:hypothetical protein